MITKGRLLVATNNGLCEYLPSSDSFRRIAIDAPSQDFASKYADRKSVV